VIELAGLFRARIVDVGREELLVEMSGTEDKIEALIDLLQPYGIVELARTGVIAMPRSEKVAGKTPVRRAAAGIQAPEKGDSGVDPTQLPPG
jgi:acetolactate synthase-1/3 small subunit